MAIGTARMIGTRDQRKSKMSPPSTNTAPGARCGAPGFPPPLARHPAMRPEQRRVNREAWMQRRHLLAGTGAALLGAWPGRAALGQGLAMQAGASQAAAAAAAAMRDRMTESR